MLKLWTLIQLMGLMENFILSKSTFHWLQWISMNLMNDFWSNFTKIDPKSLYNSLTFNLLNKNSPLMCIEKCPNCPKCGKMRTKPYSLYANVFGGPFWGELGRSDLYNKRYSFEQNHKMLNPNHLRNVQPHWFIENSKIQNSQIHFGKVQMSLKRAFNDVG